MLSVGGIQNFLSDSLLVEPKARQIRYDYGRKALLPAMASA
jgi:hypothetical protein